MTPYILTINQNHGRWLHLCPKKKIVPRVRCKDWNARSADSTTHAAVILLLYVAATADIRSALKLFMPPNRVPQLVANATNIFSVGIIVFDGNTAQSFG